MPILIHPALCREEQKKKEKKSFNSWWQNQERPDPWRSKPRGCMGGGIGRQREVEYFPHLAAEETDLFSSSSLSPLALAEKALLQPPQHRGP